MNHHKMTIREAKQEVANTLRVYLAKNEWGQYEIPLEKQRPVLLMGPPGIGKTAIMEQIAAEENVALVSYTITHHTRQSAIGLPVIRERKYGDSTVSVTEYTMSEIIASVYDKMEQTGLSEGILFLDEINCVSETLAPTMLQFLQYKTFGAHRVPEGWLIVVAGNPSEYNRAVRDFDIVTLDRLKRIDIAEDYPAWKEYAYEHAVHPSVLSYLDIKKENFYQAEAAIGGDDFVTARGWEDLSRLITSYERHRLPVNTAVIRQYLQHEEISRDFGNYYELFLRYRESYNITEILEGKESPDTLTQLQKASFDEALSFLGLFLGRLNELFSHVMKQDDTLTQIFRALEKWKGRLASEQRAPLDLLMEEQKKMEHERKRMKISGQLTEEREQLMLKAHGILADYIELLRDTPEDDALDAVREKFSEAAADYEHMAEQTKNALTNAFLFLEKTFAGRQEMVLFVTELTMNPHAVRFVSEHGCDKFFEYNKELLLDEKKTDLQRRIRQLL